MMTVLTLALNPSTQMENSLCEVKMRGGTVGSSCLEVGNEKVVG